MDVWSEVRELLAEAKEKIRDSGSSREKSTAVTKIDEARMWVNEDEARCDANKA
jgi:hypothetical protein